MGMTSSGSVPRASGAAEKRKPKARRRPARLGEKLRRIREALGLNQEQMAAQIDLPASQRHYISRFESNEREPDLTALKLYSEACRCWINALVDDGVDLPSELPCAEMSPGIESRPRKSLRRSSG